MNPKSRLVLIGVVLALCLYFLWPTVRFYQLDSDRAPLAAKAKHGTHADSMALARWDSLNGDSYQSAQAGRIKLGLDLRGGIYTTMEVDAPTLLLETAQADAVDETFEKVIDATRKESVTSEDPVIDIFTRNFDRIARPTGKTLLNYYDVGDLGADASDQQIITRLGQNIEDAVDQAMEVVRRRIDQFGVSEVTITRQAGRRIVIELPGVSEEDQIRSLLQTTARLEFKLVRNDVNTAKFFGRIDQMLAGKVTQDTVAEKRDSSVIAKRDSTKTAADTARVKGDSTLAGDTTKTKGDSTIAADTAASPTADSAKDPYAGLSDEKKAEAYQRDHPFTSLFLSQVSVDPDGKSPAQPFDYINTDILPQGEYYFLIPRTSVAKVKSMLSRTDVRNAMPDDIIFAFSADPERREFEAPRESDNDLFALYAVTREAELTGEVITNAFPSFEAGQPQVIMNMNADGADRWSNITGKNLKKRIAIVLDSAVYSAPVVQSKIPNGTSTITGSSNATEANLLAVVLKAGALKAPIRIIEERVVGPSLGEDSINKGLMSTAIATGLVFIFMFLYYRYGGAIANLALVLNILITIALLAAFQATLTLPGIGGLVLTIGMAVDGNILIYERIREELAAGKPLSRAIQAGYDKAWSAVLDTHITTLISGAILFFFGSGPVQGFAVTLMIGLTATFFTAVFVTRTVFMMNVERGAETLDFGQERVHDVEPAVAR